LSTASKASIILVTYNHESYIDDSIESILDQRCQNIEIIVVDDGSTDNTANLVSKYQKYGVAAFSKKNGGPSSAFNYGIDKAAGDVIILFSGDDVMLPDSIAARCDALSAGAFEIVSAPPVWIASNGEHINSKYQAHIFRVVDRDPPATMFWRLLTEGNFICAPSVAGHRQTFRRIGRFHEALWQLQDYEYWLRASALGCKFTFLSQPAIKYRTHNSNLSTSNPERLERELDMVMSSAPSLLPNEEIKKFLFGDGFADIDLEVESDILIPFVNLKHPRKSVRQIGRKKLQECMQDPTRQSALVKLFTAGL
jgi:glycosyltransferase involved in cell wall biosynthesis